MKKFLLIATTIISINVSAQEKIEAERPNESINVKTVPKGAFQTELGFRKTSESKEDYVWRTPNALLRYGLLDKLELRLEANLEKQHLPSENTFREGLRPIELGLKLNVFETKNETFSTGIVGQVGIPNFASSDHVTDHVYQRIRLLFENKVTEKIKLNYNAGSDWDSKTHEQNWVYTFAPEVELGHHWETFVEIFGSMTKGDIPENVIDAGIAHFISNNTKVDLSAGRGLNHHSPNYFIAAGFSFRVGGKK